MTLYLYKLTLNLDDRAVRRDLSNPYEMHRTLSRAFSIQGQDAVHPYLWRLESTASEEIPYILVQATDEACWSSLANGFLLGMQERVWDPETVLNTGRKIAFRVRANPTVNRVPVEDIADGSVVNSARGRRKRLGLWRESEQLEWMQRQATRLGLEGVEASVSQAQRLRCRKRDAMMTLSSAQFDGKAVIADPAALVEGLRRGIGHGRMLGHGMVSLAPLRA